MRFQASTEEHSAPHSKPYTQPSRNLLYGGFSELCLMGTAAAAALPLIVVVLLLSLRLPLIVVLGQVVKRRNCDRLTQLHPLAGERSFVVRLGLSGFRPTLGGVASLAAGCFLPGGTVLLVSRGPTVRHC